MSAVNPVCLATTYLPARFLALETGRKRRGGNNENEGGEQEKGGKGKQQSEIEQIMKKE